MFLKTMYAEVVLTGTVLVISVPSNGCNKMDAREGSYESMKSMGLASFRSIRPVSVRLSHKNIG